MQQRQLTTKQLEAIGIGLILAVSLVLLAGTAWHQAGKAKASALGTSFHQTQTTVLSSGKTGTAGTPSVIVDGQPVNPAAGTKTIDNGDGTTTTTSASADGSSQTTTTVTNPNQANQNSVSISVDSGSASASNSQTITNVSGGSGSYSNQSHLGVYNYNGKVIVTH